MKKSKEEKREEKELREKIEKLNIFNSLMFTLFLDDLIRNQAEQGQ